MVAVTVCVCVSMTEMLPSSGESPAAADVRKGAVRGEGDAGGIRAHGDRRA